MSIDNENIELVSVSELLTEAAVTCPYCWELLDIVIDHTDEENQQVIDCQVCCQPIVIRIHYADGNLELQAERENA